jgi:polysaccharide export outer membrane protein
MPRLRNIACLLVLLVLAGCSSAATISSENSQALARYVDAPPPRGSVGPYMLGPGDRLRVKAYSDDQLSGEYEVGSGGLVSIPLVGEVKAAGLTTQQLERTIAARMKGKLAQKPEISIEIAAYAPFYIHGEVKKAGEYPFHPGLTVADAIAMAGGLTYRANENQIYVHHSGMPDERSVTLSMPLRVHPGDNIRVSERMF